MRERRSSTNPTVPQTPSKLKNHENHKNSVSFISKIKESFIKMFGELTTVEFSSVLSLMNFVL